MAQPPLAAKWSTGNRRRCCGPHASGGVSDERTREPSELEAPPAQTGCIGTNCSVLLFGTIILSESCEEVGFPSSPIDQQKVRHGSSVAGFFNWLTMRLAVTRHPPRTNGPLFQRAVCISARQPDQLAGAAGAGAGAGASAGAGVAGAAGAGAGAAGAASFIGSAGAGAAGADSFIGSAGAGAGAVVLAAGASAGAAGCWPLLAKTKYAAIARTTTTSAISQGLPPPPV